MLKHLMVDLETLATSPDAAILTMGAVTFDPKSDKIFDEFYVRIDLESVTELGMTVDEKTVEWWGTQSAEAQDEAFSEIDRINIREAFDRLYKFCWGAKRVWSHGAAFDVVICENIFRKLNKAVPWNYPCDCLYLPSIW